MSLPIVSFDGLTYTVTLFRPDATGAMKENTYTFGEHHLSVCGAPEEALASWERSQIKGPVAEDGELYYLCARPEDVGRPSFIWLKNKEEATALRKAIKDAEDLYDYNYYREDYKCTFCGAMASECGEDHGDEMRDIMREYRNRHY
jgi:hypothetical protein